MNNKKKVVKDILVIILFYVLIFFMNNIKNIFYAIFNYTFDNNINFLNLSIILSTILISIMYIFRKYIFKKNLYLWIMFCSLLVYNFAEGYYDGFISFPFIILYVYVLLITYVVILLSDKKFEIAMVIGFSTLLISTFFVGMFGLLNIVKYFILISVVIMCIYIYTVGKNDKNRLLKAKDKLFDSGFIIFNILWMIAILGGAGMYVNSWDEYSHWAYDAKATIYYSKFGASQEIMSKTKEYAPIFTVWHYIISIFNGFSEHNLYVGLSMLIMVYLMPAFYWIKNNNFITKILAFISITFCCYLFGGVYIYSSLYADLAITVIFSSILILYRISQDDNENLTLPIILLLIIITLSKTNGFVIAFVFLLIIFINDFFCGKKVKLRLKSTFKYIMNFIKKHYKFIIAIVTPFVLWKIYIFIMGEITTEYYDFTLMPDSLKGDLELKLNFEFITNFAKKVIFSFDSNLISGKVNLSLYQFLIIEFVGLFSVFYLKNNKNLKQAVNKTIPYIIGYIAFFGLTVLAMFLMMSVYEASNLASFGRYLNWYHLGLAIFILSYILSFKIKDKNGFLNLFYIIIILLIPFSNIIYFIYNPLNSGSYSVYLKHNNKMEILNEYTPKESMVYVIDQKDTEGIMAMWYTRYYAFPRQTNASAGAITWKIKTQINADDLSDWGLTAEEWAEQLVEYDFEYVYLYSSDEYFFKETSFLYDDVEKSKKYTLFKVSSNDGGIKLIPIK